MNKTTLRLIDLEASPPEGNDQDGAPAAPMTEHDAITRKVTIYAGLAQLNMAADSSARRLPHWRTLVPAGTVALLVVAFVVALLTSERGKTPPSGAAEASQGAAAPPRTREPPPAQEALIARPTPELALPQEKAAPAFIRVAIEAEPADAELSLDGNVVATHRLKLEVPRDRAIHVVSASAPGYLPFNQQISFASDVALSIKLRRAQPPRPAVRSRSIHAEVRRRPEVRPEVRPAVKPEVRPEVKPAAVQAPPRIEPGMRLDPPPARRNSMPIDEMNPYKP